uniref:Helicase/UvrB N-terminal domain-containing protein n=1 Tax=viral metagenome TaxID=1070528 RepID=A0A6C0LGQ4_9ZZZZ
MRKSSSSSKYSEDNENSQSANYYRYGDDSDDDGEDASGSIVPNEQTADCIRNRSNFTIPKTFHMIDKKDFNPEMLNVFINNGASPKLKLLLDQIRLLDEKDMKDTGKLHKHLIFTDANRSTYGAKIVASALTANGLHMAYHPQGTGFSMTDDKKLKKTKHANYAVLLSKSFFDRPVNAKIRKVILDKFNSRPDNTYGELVRFIVLDQGFKEGIDLFDVKYVHLLEPLAVNADEKQAIGRATRFCGQKGLVFHPRFGWPLFVFKYDVTISQELQDTWTDFDKTKTLFELYIKNSNLDMRKIIFANQLEGATIDAAVDKELTKPVHLFAIESPDDIVLRGGGGGVSKVSGVRKSIAPTKKMNLVKMHEYIKANFSKFKYPPLKLENKCTGGAIGGAVNGNIVSFTPTQDFVRHYFQPSSAYKGLLLHHSVGTGKTCTAIATATTSFDIENYTILWVTRHTLKTDIWKNMFGQVCSIDIQNKIKKGLVLPNKIVSKSKYVSANWMDPISYKQFSNMLLKRNKIYDEMVKRNGKDDPLRKTLLIIDEAHKLYSPTVAKSEKPNTDILEKMIHNSYDKSGTDSVRVLLMTATPFTEDGMEMIKLLNLLRDDELFPTDFQDFTSDYLHEGYFTPSGLRDFKNKVSGYISYLNRSQDARNFAHPVIRNVYSDMSYEKVDMKGDLELKMSKNEMANIKAVKKELKELKDKEKECVKLVNATYKVNAKDIMSQRKEGEAKCKTEPKGKKAECTKKVMDEYKALLEKINNGKEDKLNGCDVKNTSNFKRLNVDLEDYNAKRDIIKENKIKMKPLKVELKVFNNKKKAILDKVKEMRQRIRPKEIDYKHTILGIKRKYKDRKEKAAALKEYNKKSAPLLAELKDLKDLRAEASKANTNTQVFKYSNGMKKLKKVSQVYAIQKYCLGNGTAV